MSHVCGAGVEGFVDGALEDLCEGGAHGVKVFFGSFSASHCE